MFSYFSINFCPAVRWLIFMNFAEGHWHSGCKIFTISWNGFLSSIKISLTGRWIIQPRSFFLYILIRCLGRNPFKMLHFVKIVYLIFTYLFRGAVLGCIWSVREVFCLFSHCPTEPSSLQWFHQLCNFAVVKEMEIRTLALISWKSSAKKVFLLSLGGKHITRRCLNFDCQRRKLIVNKDCIWKLVWNPENNIVDKPKRIHQ